MDSPFQNIVERILNLTGRGLFYDTRFLLSVSGGIDSMLLLHLFSHLYQSQHLKEKPIVFHLDHRLREDSGMDARLVFETAEGFNFRSIIVHRDVARYASEKGMGLEEAGRYLRYRILGRILRYMGEAMAVVGHHSDDYVESILLHLIRGGGPSSLSTMGLFEMVHEIQVFRPLMVTNREEITEISNMLSIQYREDESNTDLRFKRNRIRHEIAPLLKKEGLNSKTMWQNFHDYEAPTGRVSDGPSADYLKLDRALVFGLTGRKRKEILDHAMRVLGEPPLSRTLFGELERQILSRMNDGGCNLHLESKRILLWSASVGPVWIFRSDCALFREAHIRKNENTQGGYVWEIGYNNRKKTYHLRIGESVIFFKNGLRVDIRRNNENSGSRKLKEVFQEYRIPPMLRSRIPLVYDENKKRITAILFSFLGGRMDRFFR